MAAAKIVKKPGKENTAPARTSRKGADEVVSDADDFDEMAEDAPRTKTAGGKGGKVGKGSSAEEEAGYFGGASVSRKLEAITAERDRLRTQRDTYSKQFDELSNLRTSDTEKLFTAFKEKSETRANAQAEVISSLTAMNEQLQSRIQALEKAKADAAGVFGGDDSAPLVKADPKEVKALKERLAKVESGLRRRNDEFDHLDKLYKAEVAESRRLLASRSGASVPVTEQANPKEEVLIDQASLRLYEDIMDLSIANVRIKDGRFGPKDKEYTFTCVQTVGKRSFTFKLRSYLEIDASLAAAKAKNPYVPTIEFTPSLQGEADAAFIEQLGFFKNTFVVPRSQLGQMFETLRSNMVEAGDAE